MTFGIRSIRSYRHGIYKPSQLLDSFLFIAIFGLNAEVFCFMYASTFPFKFVFIVLSIPATCLMIFSGIQLFKSKSAKSGT